MSIELMRLLEEAVERFRDTAGLRVMLIRAIGRYFSAGAGLKEGGGEVPFPDRGSQVREQHRRGASGMRRRSHAPHDRPRLPGTHIGRRCRPDRWRGRPHA